MLAQPLAQRGIASVLPIVPFYASRKPKDQFRACLLHVSDLFSLGAGVSVETSTMYVCVASSVLFSPIVHHPPIFSFDILEEQNFGPFGVTGISLGG